MKSPDSLPERILALAHNKFGTAHGFKKRFALASGLAQAQISKLIGGKSEPTVPTLRKVASGLGMSLLELVDPDEAARSGVLSVPVLGWVAAGQGADEPADTGDIIHVHEMFRRANVAYRVHGLSMLGAGIVEGDILAVRRGDVAQSGDIVIAWVRDRGMLVKRLKVSNDGRKYLWSEDGTGEPIPLGEEDRIHGILIGVMRNCENKQNGAGTVPPKGKPKPPAKAKKK